VSSVNLYLPKTSADFAAGESTSQTVAVSTKNKNGGLRRVVSLTRAGDYPQGA
jgi:hypothetical protein